MNLAVNWAWTLNPIALADTGESGTGILWFSGWPELIAVVLLGAGFIILVGTLGAMWKNRWRDPMRDVASSRLDRPSSLELDDPNSPAESVGVVYSRSQGSDSIAPPSTEASQIPSTPFAPRVVIPKAGPEPKTPGKDHEQAARPHFLPATTPAKSNASHSANGTAARTPQVSPPPTVDEAQRLLELMNQAEDQAARLNSHFDEREAALRSLISEADGKLAQLRAAEQAAAMHVGRSIPGGVLTAAASHLISQDSVARESVAQGTLHSGVHPASPVVTTISRQAAPAMLATATALHSGQSSSRTGTRSEVRPVSGAQSQQTRVHAEIPPATPITPTLIAADPAGPDPLTGEIYRLADQGMPHVEIARRLNQHVGKVELILALRPG